MPVDHYENFPVASFLLPARLREPVEAIYAFARSADDLADEGNALPGQRLADLDHYRQQLRQIDAGQTPDDPLFQRLAQTLRHHALSSAPLFDLLSAFSQDVVKTRYANFAELRDYCHRSADPVGRLMLALYRADTPLHCQQADAICTGLQLVNFWQDVAIDWDKNRIYLPQDECAHFGVDESSLQRYAARHQIDSAFANLLAQQLQRARSWLLEGAPLARSLPGRIGWELRLVVLGGLRIIDKITANHYNVFGQRPTLSKADTLILAWQALRYAHLPVGTRHDTR